jgi:hypothetical protein
MQMNERRPLLYECKTSSVCAPQQALLVVYSGSAIDTHDSIVFDYREASTAIRDETHRRPNPYVRATARRARVDAEVTVTLHDGEIATCRGGRGRGSPRRAGSCEHQAPGALKGELVLTVC